MDAEERLERRGLPRAGVASTAMVYADGRYIGTYAVQNLAASGALLEGETPLAVGDVVRVVLRLLGHARHIQMEARIVRREEHGEQSVFAIQFPYVPAALHEALESFVLNRLVQPSALGLVLVVDAVPELGAQFRKDLHELGYLVALSRTALDAMFLLQGPENVATAVVASATLTGISGLRLLDFVGARSPQVRRVLTCRPEDAHMHDKAVGAGRVHAILETPWTRESLVAALGGPH